jgi:5-formyltetrahydrofolate cyclo-ligase
MSLNWLKRSQRRQLSHIRSHLPAWFQQTCSLQICDDIVNLPAYQQATHIGLYRALNNEIDLAPLWHHALAHGKTCYFPVLHANHHLSFIAADESDDFQKNQFGIFEPAKHCEASYTMPPIELFFLPLVGFDAHGNRLGTGAGCYDRTLAEVKDPYCIGVGYAFQQLKFILTELTDMPLDLIITEHGVIHPSHRS